MGGGERVRKRGRGRKKRKGKERKGEGRSEGRKRRNGAQNGIHDGLSFVHRKRREVTIIIFMCSCVAAGFTGASGEGPSLAGV